MATNVSRPEEDASATGYVLSGLEVYAWSNATVVVVFTCITAVIFTIEFGNLLTIISFITYRRLRRPRYIPVVSMAVSDLLYGLSAIFYLVSQNWHAPAPEKKIFTLIAVILVNVFASVSTWHLVVLAVDRFDAVRFPMSYRRVMTSCCITKMTVACWLAAVTVGCIFLLLLNSGVNSGNACYDGAVPLAFKFAIQFSHYVTTIATLVILCFGVLVVVRGARLRLQRTKDDVDSAHRLRGTFNRTQPIGSRAYLMITIIIVAYIVSWAPYFIVQIIRLTSMSMCLSPTARIAMFIGVTFGTLNAGVNFIIYALVNRDFRHAYKSTLKKLFYCGKRASSLRTASNDELYSPGSTLRRYQAATSTV